MPPPSVSMNVVLVDIDQSAPTPWVNGALLTLEESVGSGLFSSTRTLRYRRGDDGLSIE